MTVLYVLTALFSMVAIGIAILSLNQIDQLEQELEQLKVRLAKLEIEAVVPTVWRKQF